MLWIIVDGWFASPLEASFLFALCYYPIFGAIGPPDGPQ